MSTLEQYLKKHLQQSTVKSYLYEIDKFRAGNRNTAAYDYKQVMAYIQTLRRQYQSASITRILSAIKQYYNYLEDQGIRDDNPARAIVLRDRQKKPLQLQDFLSENELQKLLLPRKERYSFLEKRNQIIISLLVHQALKTGEIVQLKRDAVCLEKAQLQVSGTRQTHSRILPLKADQILLFYHYLKQRSDQCDALLLNKRNHPITGEDINYLISTYQKGFTKKLTSVTIRQSVITLLLAQGQDLRKVQQFAGHKYLDTTEKYKQSGIKALQNAIEKHHPVQ